LQIADRRLQNGRAVQGAAWSLCCLVVGAGCGRQAPDRGGAADVPPPLRAEWQPLVGEYVRDGVVLLLLERADARIVTDSAPGWQLQRGCGHPRDDSPARLWVVVHDSVSAVAGLRDARGLGRRDPGQPVFRIGPVSELRREARIAVPPTEAPDLLAPVLVDVQALDSTIRLDVRYASADNFLGEPVYASARAYLQRPAAEALVRAHRGLAAAGYGLLIHDAYRPWHISLVFWEATADSLRRFVDRRRARGTIAARRRPDAGRPRDRGGRDMGGYDEPPRGVPDIPDARCSGGTASCCARHWSARDSAASPTSGGTSTSGTGASTRY
jgi:hypothetical protein